MDGHQPAFPLPAGTWEGISSRTGMTLLDYFAAAALTGLLRRGLDDDRTAEERVNIAYHYATAMLAERARRAPAAGG